MKIALIAILAVVFSILAWSIAKDIVKANETAAYAQGWRCGYEEARFPRDPDGIARYCP